MYRELLEYATQLGRAMNLTDYIIWGGFPKRVEYGDTESQKKYLNEINDTIVLNDIISRYKIRRTEIFTRLVNYVLVSNARIFSARSVADYMKTNSFKCTVTTIIKYLGYLEEAYVVQPVRLYSTKAKRELSYYYKMYNEDVSFNSIRAFNNRFDLTHKTFYIQAAYSVAEEKAYEREFGAFNKFDNSIQKIVISNDEIDYSTSTVRHIQFRNLVTMNEL